MLQVTDARKVPKVRLPIFEDGRCEDVPCSNCVIILVKASHACVCVYIYIYILFIYVHENIVCMLYIMCIRIYIPEGPCTSV